MTYEKKIQIFLENGLESNGNNEEVVKDVITWLRLEMSWNPDVITSSEFWRLVEYTEKLAEEIIKDL